MAVAWDDDMIRGRAGELLRVAWRLTGNRADAEDLVLSGTFDADVADRDAGLAREATLGSRSTSLTSRGSVTGRLLSGPGSALAPCGPACIAAAVSRAALAVRDQGGTEAAA